MTAYVRGACVTSQLRRDVNSRGHCNICCLNVKGSVDHMTPAVAAFFDLDKTVISKSSTLAFGRPFYKYGLISRADAVRSVAGQLVFMVAGAGHSQMERIREWVGGTFDGLSIIQMLQWRAIVVDERLNVALSPWKESNIY